MAAIALSSIFESHVTLLAKLIIRAITYHDSSAGTWVFDGRRWLDPKVTSDVLLLMQVVGHVNMRACT